MHQSFTALPLCLYIWMYFINLYSSDSTLVSKWSRGCILGSAQNFARELMESPANHMTPTMFVEAVSNKLGRMRHSLTNPSSLQVIPRYSYTYSDACKQSCEDTVNHSFEEERNNVLPFCYRWQWNLYLEGNLFELTCLFIRI